MACWSPENATKAYISTLKMERKENEPNAAEFISALAAGNNAQVMVAACGQKMVTPNNLLALIAAARQTGGQVICIVPTHDYLHSLKRALESDVKFINFIVGNASEMLLNEYKDSDFFLVDCNLSDYEGIVRGIQARRGKERSSVLVGYSAFCKGSSWQWSGLRTHLLPIGDGLLVTRIGANTTASRDVKNMKGGAGKSNWIVKVDKCTGEEHVFRVRSSQRKLAVAV